MDEKPRDYQGLLNRLFLPFFCLACLVILTAVFAAVQFSMWTVSLTLCYITAWLLLQYKGLPLLEKLGTRKLTLIFYAMTLAMLVVQLLNGRHWQKLTGDVEAIYTGVREAVQFGHLTDSNVYFLQYAHQRGMLLLLFLYNYILRVTGIQTVVSAYGNIVLVCCCVSGAIVFIYHGAQRLWGAARAFTCCLFLFSFLPFYTYIIWCYSNTVGILLVSAAFWLYSMASTSEKKTWRIALFVLCGGAFAFSSLVMGITNVVIVAVLIHLLLSHRFLSFLKHLGLFAAGFVAVYASFQLVLHASGIIDFTAEKQHRFPTDYWLMVGLMGEGGYSEEEYQMMVSLPDEDARAAYTSEKIGFILSESSPGQLARQLFAKTRVSWGYQNYAELGNFAIWLCDARHLAMMLLYLAGGVLAFVHKKPGWHSLFQLIIFGLFLFFLVWEAKLDNLFGLMPLLSVGLAATDWSGTLQRLFARRKNAASSQ